MAVSSGSAPHFAWITVNGQNFPLEAGSVTRAATRKSGSFSGTLELDYPGVEQTFANLGDNTATVSVISVGQQATLITGEIDEAEFDYIRGDVHISGRDASAKLHATKSAEKWINKKPHEIIQDLGSRVGMSVNIDQSAMMSLNAGRYVEIDWSKLTDGMSYASVVHKLTEFMGAHWYVDQKGALNIKGSQDNTGSPYVINYSRDPSSGAIVSDALQLHIRRNIQAGKGVKVKINSWHERKKAAYTGTYSVGGNGTSQEYVYHLPGLTQDHVNQFAKSKAKDHARHEIEVQAVVVGDPSLTIDQALQLNGTSFSQSLTIDSIQDEFGMGGHTTHISAKSQKAGRTETPGTGIDDLDNGTDNAPVGGGIGHQ